jgi:hypothetical protein
MLERLAHRFQPPVRRALFDQACHPLAAKTLAGPQAGFQCGRIETAAMPGGVVHREALPEPVALLGTKGVEQRLFAMGVEVVYGQMDSGRSGITRRDPPERSCQLRPGTAFGGPGLMPVRLGLDHAEHVGRPAARVVVAPARDLAGCRRGVGPHRVEQLRRPCVPRDHRRVYPKADSAPPALFPSGLGIRGPASARTTFSRHGFSWWLANRRRMVSRLTLRTTPRRCASCAVSARVHCACLSGEGPHTGGTIAAGCLASGSLSRAIAQRRSQTQVAPTNPPRLARIGAHHRGALAQRPSSVQ